MVCKNCGNPFKVIQSDLENEEHIVEYYEISYLERNEMIEYETFYRNNRVFPPLRFCSVKCMIEYVKKMESENPPNIKCHNCGKDLKNETEEEKADKDSEYEKKFGKPNGEQMVTVCNDCYLLALENEKNLKKNDPEFYEEKIRTVESDLGRKVNWESEK